MKLVLPIILLLTACAGCRPELSTVDGVSVRTAEYQGWGQSGRQILWGHTLAELAERSLPTESSRTNSGGDRVISFLKSTERYDITVTDENRARELWQNVLERSFGVRALRDTREIDVLILVPIHGQPVTMEATTADKFKEDTRPRERCRHGLAAIFPPKQRVTHTFTACDMNTLAAWLENKRDKVILNETDLPGAFDFQLFADPHTGETLESSLAQLGLELQPAKRTVRAIYVEPTGQPVPHPVARLNHYQKNRRPL